MTKILGVELDQHLRVTLKDLLDVGVMDHLEEIRDIAEISEKEQKFEKMLSAMKSSWRMIKFETSPFKPDETDIHILVEIDQIIDKLDEDLQKTISIASSSFVGQMASEVMAWKDTLNRTQEIIEVWIVAQRSWKYLQPIFFSEDIIREMAQAGKDFNEAQKSFARIMSQTIEYSIVMEVCN